MDNALMIRDAIRMLRNEGYTVIDPHEHEDVTPPASKTEAPYCYPDYVDNSFSVIE